MESVVGTRSELVKVGHIGHAPNPKSQGLLTPVLERKGSHGNPSRLKDRGLPVHTLEGDLGDAAAFYRAWRKNIVKSPKEIPLCPGVSKGGDGFFLEKIKTADFIDPVNVVRVGVGIKDCVKPGQPSAQCLGAKVCGGIDEEALLMGLDPERASEALVLRVGRSANRAGASDEGNPCGGPAAKNSDFYPSCLAHFLGKSFPYGFSGGILGPLGVANESSRDGG